MGMEKFFYDFSRIYSNNNILKEIVLDRLSQIYPIEHIFFDYNSYLYKTTKNIENEINIIIKFLYAMQYSHENKDIIIKK